MQKKVNIYPDVDSLSTAFADALRQKVNGKNGFFSLALSGGSTPTRIFRYLAQNHSQDIQWSKVLFFWGDERCVEPTSDESNYKMAVSNLLDPLKIDQTRVFRVKGELQPEAAALDYRDVISKNVPKLHEYPQFDLVLLGLGDDGHTASIFPGDENSLFSDSITGVATHPESGQKRITLTMPVINNARSVFFLVTGASKASMVQTVLAGRSYPQYPAAFVKPTQGTCDWMLDEAAARFVTDL